MFWNRGNCPYHELFDVSIIHNLKKNHTNHYITRRYKKNIVVIQKTPSSLGLIACHISKISKSLRCQNEV